MIDRIISLVVLISAFCNAQVVKQTNQCEPFIYERLRNYFDINELSPTQVINNDLDLGRWESRTQKVSIGNQTIEWIDEVEARRGAKSSLRINGELIPLGGKETINAPDEDRKLKLSVANQWNQIKLYRIGEQILIGISMGPRMCTGLMCSVGVQLWYDVRSKRKTFFGTYRSDSDVRLFRWREKIYTVTTNFQGDPNRVTSPGIMRYEMYGLESAGHFQFEKDTRGIPYFIKHTQYIDTELKGGESVRQKQAQMDSLEQNWVEDVLAYDR